MDTMTKQTGSNPLPEEKIAIYRLSAYVQKYGDEALRHAMEDFVPIHDSDTEAFLKTRAIEMETRQINRTFLAISKEDFSILGYFTIGIKCLRIPDDHELRGRRLRGISIDPKTKTAQAYLLGQLARSADAPDGLGSWLINEALEHVRAANSEVGCRMLRLDCVDALVPYYERNGFAVVSRSKNGEALNQMITLIDDAREGAS